LMGQNWLTEVMLVAFVVGFLSGIFRRLKQ
jgi:hypothetical protein